AMLLALMCRQPHHREIKVWARRALELAERTADPDLRVRSTLHVLAYQLWIGDLETAEVLAGDLRMLTRATEVSTGGRMASALMQVRLAWLRGDFDGARQTAEAALALGRTTGLDLFRDRLIGEARLAALAAGDAAGTPGADVHLAQATDLAHQLDSALFQFTALLVEADLASRRGDEGCVMKALARAMPLGRSHGYVNTWMWSPKMMAELAARALDADIEVDYVRRLVRERKLVPAEAPLEVETWPWPV